MSSVVKKKNNLHRKRKGTLNLEEYDFFSMVAANSRMATLISQTRTKRGDERGRRVLSRNIYVQLNVNRD